MVAVFVNDVSLRLRRRCRRHAASLISRYSPSATTPMHLLTAPTKMKLAARLATCVSPFVSTSKRKGCSRRPSHLFPFAIAGWYVMLEAAKNYSVRSLPIGARLGTDHEYGLPPGALLVQFAFAGRY